METLTAAIARIVGGDLSFLPVVLATDQHVLWDAATRLPRLVVSRIGLAKVLKDWRQGSFSPEDVQRWASFVRRGYVSGGASGEVRPIPIEYDAEDEAQIAEIVGRLDEIGDRVDGHIEVQEVEEMLQALQQHQ